MLSLKSKAEPILESGGDITVGRLKVVEGEGNRMLVTEEQPIATALDELFSLKIQASRQGGELVYSHTAVFFCREWPEIASYEGTIVVDLTKKPSIVKKVHEIGRFTGMYHYKVDEKKFTKKFKGAIPDVNLTIKLAEYHYIKGKEYAGRKDFKSAIPEYDEAIKLYPEYCLRIFPQGQRTIE